MNLFKKFVNVFRKGKSSRDEGSVDEVGKLVDFEERYAMELILRSLEAVKIMYPDFEKVLENMDKDRLLQEEQHRKINELIEKAKKEGVFEKDELEIG